MRLLLAITLLMAATPTFSEGLDDYRTLHVSGNHEISVMPDTAMLSITAYGEDKDADASKTIADKQLRAIISITKKLGVDEKHIDTSAMRLQPRYSYRQNRDRELEAYETSYDVTIKLKALNKLGELLKQLTQSNISRINNIQYTLDDDAVMKEKALAGAMQHARKKAALLAKEAGVTLGKLLKIHEGEQQFSNPQPRMMRAMAMDSAQTESAVAPPVGEMNISASVTAIYELDD